MSSCARARDLFGTYWDDETTLAEREWLEGHLQGCAACRVEYESLSRTLELVGSLPREEAAPDMAQRALAAARRASPAPDVVFVREGAPRWVPLAAAAGLVLIAMAAFAPMLLRAPGTSAVAHLDTPVVAPHLVAVAAPSAAPAAESAGTAARTQAAVADGLFDHTEDVDLVLDPVTLRRGRAHTVAHLPEGVQGEQAVITF